MDREQLHGIHGPCGDLAGQAAQNGGFSKVFIGGKQSEDNIPLGWIRIDCLDFPLSDNKDMLSRITLAIDELTRCKLLRDDTFKASTKVFPNRPAKKDCRDEQHR